MPPSTQELLQQAIARNAGVMLALPSAGMMRVHKSRFLQAADDGFWVQSVPHEGPLIDELIATQRPANITFPSGGQSLSFVSALRRRQERFTVNAGTVVEAILAGFPLEVQAVQRRRTYRVLVPPTSALAVRVWRMPPRAALSAKPMAAQEVLVKLRDICVGGIGVICEVKDAEQPKIRCEDRLRIELRDAEFHLLLEGSLCAKPFEAGGVLRAGIQFTKLEKDIEGRRKLAELTRIVGSLQRQAARTRLHTPA